VTRTPLRRALTRLRRAVLTFTALGATVVAGAVLAPAAQAGPWGGGGAAPPSSSGASATVSGGCRVYGSGKGYGVVCPSPGGGANYLRNLLRGDPVPTCYQGEVDDNFVPPRETFERGQWAIEVCMEGYDARAVQVGPVSYTIEFVFLPHPQQIAYPTENQRAFLRAIQQNSQIPQAVVQASPSASPRVGSPVSFYVPELYTIARPVEVRNIRMRAELVYTEVRPRGAADTPVGCDGPGVEAGPEDTPATVPGACWYTFDRSSNLADSGRDGDRYPLHARALWQVEYSDNGGPWQSLGTFAREAVNPTRVTEVQTLVIPPGGNA